MASIYLSGITRSETTHEDGTRTNSLSDTRAFVSALSGDVAAIGWDSDTLSIPGLGEHQDYLAHLGTGLFGQTSFSMQEISWTDEATYTTIVLVQEHIVVLGDAPTQYSALGYGYFVVSSAPLPTFNNPDAFVIHFWPMQIASPLPRALMPPLSLTRRSGLRMTLSGARAKRTANFSGAKETTISRSI